mmetsp:Transcript_13447/g.47845  ORF Transcript_13447/g.47845 Transcript_13447/m.47845 type:complete len:172 (+) Transcript_13447:193-708(+)
MFVVHADAVPAAALARLDGLLGEEKFVRSLDADDLALCDDILLNLGWPPEDCESRGSRIRLSHYASRYAWQPHVDLAVNVAARAEPAVEVLSDTTVLIYLSTCARGGETVFSSNGRTIKVKPKRGTAVSFDHGILHAAAQTESTKRVAQFKFKRRRRSDEDDDSDDDAPGE